MGPPDPYPGTDLSMPPAEPILAGLSAKQLILLALAAVTVYYVWNWAVTIRRAKDGGSVLPSPWQCMIGAIANFFDTLGIGSFATTTAMFRVNKDVDDRHLPGTLNVGHTLPTITQAFIYISIIEVEIPTLVLLIVAAVLGMWLGAGFVAKLPRRNIQLGMGIALLVAAALTLRTLLASAGDDAGTLGLSGGLLIAGIIGNFVLGMLMSLGIGLYGPCLIMISMLGMNPKAAFPIMMGSCAFLMPTGSVKFMKTGVYDLRAALGLALGGIPATLVAAFWVGSMDLQYVRWLVIVVVLFTAWSLISAAQREKATA